MPEENAITHRQRLRDREEAEAKAAAEAAEKAAAEAPAPAETADPKATTHAASHHKHKAATHDAPPKEDAGG